ncbi:hypothetical protein [Hyphomonas sp.]|jgi:hypothetical protein|uniref:hypothetical protein n=1 Tax=Hyphomonas sp. TaxID=87 RepID=UPI0032D912D5
MSIVALQVRDNYIIMAGDGVSTDPATGKVAAYVSKITTLPDLDCAIAITGVGGFHYVLQWKMPTWVTDFDDLVEALPELVYDTHNEIHRNNMVQGDNLKTNVVVAGWSINEQKYKAVRVLTYAKESTDAETGETTRLAPFVVHEFTGGGVWISAAPTDDASKRFGLMEDIEGEDDAAFLTRVICAGRASSGMISQDGSPYRFNAGGFVQLAFIQRSDIRSWITYRWPEDVIGEPIRPELGSPLPPSLSLVEPV